MSRSTNTAIDPQDLAEQRDRILKSTVKIANAHILPLTAAHQECQDRSRRLEATLQHKESEIRQAWHKVARRDSEILHLQDRLCALEQDLAFERHQRNRLRDNEATKEYQLTQLQRQLHRREGDWTIWLHQAKRTISNLLKEFAEAARALYHAKSPFRIAGEVEYEALRTLEEAPGSAAPVRYGAFEVPGAVPMARQRGYMGHGYHPREG